MKVQYKMITLSVMGLGIGTLSISNVKGDEMNKADIHTENVSSMVADQSNKINSTFINKVEETPVTNTIENNTTVTENPVYESQNVTLDNQGQEAPKEILNDIKENPNSTIYVDYNTDNSNSLQALIGVSNSDSGYRNSYASIFIRDNGELGAEVRDTKDNTNYLFATPASLYGSSKGKDLSNKVAFVANADEKSYKLFANGTMVFNQKVDKFKSIRDILGINNIRLGGVNREGTNAYSFKGQINDIKFYNKALSDEELLNLTHNSSSDTLIFKAGDSTKSNYFRIPAMYTLKDGRIIASADARYGGTHDARSKINIATAYSDDNGKTWSTPTLALKFDDYAEQTIDWPRDNVGKNVQIQGSASFIDSAIVQDEKTGKIYLLADFMPAGIGNNNSIKNDSGYKEINGKYYLKLHLNSESAYNYSIRENGVIYNDTTNTPTEYTVDKDYNVLQNGKYLYVEQYSVKFNGTNLIEYHNGNKVKMNIFYKDSLLKITPTNFVGYTESSDNGQTWSSPRLLPTFMGLYHNGTYLSPGQGLYTDNGRIIFSSYANRAMVFIMSDDGQTWKGVQATLPFANATAEAQMVELSPGVIRTYMRTTAGKIGYITSKDNGNTWDNVKYLDIVHNTSYGTQLSVIKYSQEIDGHEAIIMSTPDSTSGRRNGQIWVGLVDKVTNEVNWKYHYSVDKPNYGYSYSALTETVDHKIALLYEKYDSWSRNELHLKNVLKFDTFEIKDLVNDSTCV